MSLKDRIQIFETLTYFSSYEIFTKEMHREETIFALVQLKKVQ